MLKEQSEKVASKQNELISTLEKNYATL